MRYILYKHSLQTNTSAYTTYIQNQLSIDVLCVWHAYRSSTFAKTRPIKPDYLLLVLDTVSLTKPQFAFPYLLQYATALLDGVVCKAAVVNEIGKVVFLDITESNAVLTNTKPTDTVQSTAIIT